jgi:hypothetical protein
MQQKFAIKTRRMVDAQRAQRGADGAGLDKPVTNSVFERTLIGLTYAVREAAPRDAIASGRSRAAPQQSIIPTSLIPDPSAI